MGLLAALYVREVGIDEAERNLLASWRADRPNPPFVLSDAFPGDLLPAPACLGLFKSLEGEANKQRTRVSWLTKEEFQEVQSGRLPQSVIEDKSERIEPFQDRLRLRNAIDRGVNSSSVTGTSTLYDVPLRTLSKGIGHLSIYAHVDPEKKDFLTQLIHLLADAGFGADAAVGQGDVELIEEAAPFSLSVDNPSGFISLSTFQPAPKDPVAGWWRSFIKYGRLGPELPTTSVFKRPQWMLRPGACFFTGSKPGEWYGRWIPDTDLLPENTISELA